MTVLVMILVDALRYSFLSKQYTPYLSSLGTACPLKTILGYSDAIKATLFTGTYPDRHGYWTKCCFRPTNSPFKGFKVMKLIDNLPSFYIKRGIKFILGRTLCKIPKLVYGYHDIDIFNIPLNVVEFFDMSIKKSMEEHTFKVPTIFDLLRKHNVSFHHIESARLGSRFIHHINSISRNDEVVLIDIHYLDHAAHRFGVKSPSYFGYLHLVDHIIKMIIKKLIRLSPELGIIVFSDHGIVQTERYINLEPLTKNDGFGRDFVFFLDSTMIHIWYLNPSKIDEVRDMFNQLGVGSFLSEREKKQLRIKFDHRLFGDDIYLLLPLYSIFPNFISLIKPKAMHAYHPKYAHQKGFIIVRPSGKRYTHLKNIVEVVDILPTAADLLHLKTPPTCEGTSLIEH